MWTINFGFIYGFMVGLEIFDPNDGIQGFAIDLGIFRIMVLKEDDDDQGKLKFI